MENKTILTQTNTIERMNTIQISKTVQKYKLITISFRENKGSTKQNGFELQKKYKWTKRRKE